MQLFKDFMFVLMFVAFLLIFMHCAIVMCFQRSTTPPIPEFHRLPLPNNFFDQYVTAAGRHALAPKPDKIGDAIKQDVPPLKKRKKSHTKPSEPSSGAPIESHEITFDIKGR